MNDTIAYLALINSRIASSEAIVLDAGCGAGRFSGISRGRYVGLDITTKPYGNYPRCLDVAGSVRHLPFRDASFDLVFVVYSLHMFAAPVLCLMDIRRALKPGGRFLCFDYTLKTHEGLRDALFPQESVTSYNLLDGRSMVGMCRLAGFNKVTLGCFLPSLGLCLPIPRLVRPGLVPLLDLRGGCWVVEGINT